MKVVFSDFDGTLTVNDRLAPVFFDLLDLIEKNGSELVVVSGRSLSWGHFLLTHFPLKRVIMEGGGVIVEKKDSGKIVEECLVSDEDLNHLRITTDSLLDEVPETVLSADSFGRKTDRAIEFSLMSPQNVEKTESYLLKRKANFTRSNVHVNYWYGNISKSYAVDHFFKTRLQAISKEDTVFFGDSLNDESMFESFPNTVGVSNIIHVLDRLHHRPKVILQGDENHGAHGVYNHLKSLFN